ncbi:unnamed protein product [Nezara viridula]|uniref:Uncharacterized protein n=1 Tax=Nezara viridula TaxID=85310 RepID=A0A9P0H5X5_NEZVI|nr:unnamed protein product [Nezara viridula]
MGCSFCSIDTSPSDMSAYPASPAYPAAPPYEASAYPASAAYPAPAAYPATGAYPAYATAPPPDVYAMPAMQQPMPMATPASPAYQDDTECLSCLCKTLLCCCILEWCCHH